MGSERTTSRRGGTRSADGKGWAVVTGASAGIGRALAVQLAGRGHPVLAVARRRSRLERLASEAPVEPLVADLSTREGVAAVAERAGELDLELLVNNAGLGTFGAFADLPLERELELIRVNIEAIVELTHLLLPQLLRRGRAGVINVASEMAFQPMPYFATYAASQAFVLSHSEALTEQLRRTGVKVTAIAPGFVDTEFGELAGSREAQSRMPHLSPERTAAAALRAHERGRAIKVVGPFYALLALGARIAPRALLRRMMGRMFSPDRG